MSKVRVRFAPSPTGGLHLGGVRTVLYNYLFARKHGGDFILRIEDTDRNRYVEGAEEYIVNCLEWCGLTPDESPQKGGAYGPYRQSERKNLYAEYALQLVKSGHAYYAFDTPEEIEKMRKQHTSGSDLQYDHSTRTKMRNSLTLDPAETEALLKDNTPYVIRIKMPQDTTVRFTDMIRGEISFDTNIVDDKVLLKADGMPTYHLAVVVDDYLMKITHAFRGEEWLPSAPVHILLWDYLGWKHHMPEWAHLPLILKPDGHGKLSKRDGDRLGFPVFAMNWSDPRTGETTGGFREMGFLPEAFINMLAMLGWNDGSEQEIFALDELVKKFSIERVHKGGAKFDFEKAQWFNHQYIQQKNEIELIPLVKPFIQKHVSNIEDDFLQKVISAIKDRCTLLSDFWQQGHFFFETPEIKELNAVKEKWNEQKKQFFENWISIISQNEWNHGDLETSFNGLLPQYNLKKGDVLLPFRIMLVGAKYGPGVFHIAELIGKKATIERITNILNII